MSPDFRTPSRIGHSVSNVPGLFCQGCARSVPIDGIHPLTPSPLIFWNESGNGGPGLKFLSSKELWAKYWEQTACEWERAFPFDEIYVCYPVYLIVKSRELRRKSDRLCRNGKNAGKCWVRGISPFHFSKKLKVNRPRLRSVLPTRRTPRRAGQPLSWRIKPVLIATSGPAPIQNRF